MTSTTRRFAKADDIPPGEIRQFEIDGHAYCVVHLEDGGFRAIDDRCTHEDESLSDGDLDGCDVECPAHGSRFNVLTGEVSGVPANIPTKTYGVTVDGDDLVLDV